MAVQLPAHATPNELLNFEYIQVMRQIRGLPNRGLVDSEVRYTEWHQPPVYFTLAALVGLGVPVPTTSENLPPPIEWPANPAYLATHRGNLNPVIHITPQNTPLLYTSRFAATFLGIIGLAALYRAGREVHSVAVGLLMVSILAFQPNYLHLSASVNNDMPLTALSAIVLAYTVLIIHNDKPPRRFLGLGLLAAAAILAKVNGVFVLVYLVAAWTTVILRHRDWSRTLKSMLYSLAGLIPPWAAWLALNTIRMKDTLGLEGSLPVGRVLALGPGDFALLLPWLDDIWRSFWLDWSSGGVGYGPDWYYVLWVLFLLFALLGWLRRPLDRQSWLVLPVVLLGIVAISYLYFAVKALTVKEAGFLVPEGRWWLPVMPGVAWVAAAGFARWWPESYRDKVLVLASFVPLGSTFLLLWFFYPALYPRANQLQPSAVTSHDSAIVYNNQLALLEAAVDPITLSQETQLSLTWQAIRDIEEDYTVAVQLLVPEQGGWQKIDEQYSFPGLGLNPTSNWHQDEVYEDKWALLADGELNGPTLAQLIVHLQLRGANLQATLRGQPIDPPVALSIPVRPQEPLEIRNPLHEPVTFGEMFELAGIEVLPDDEDLLVTLWWRAAQPANDDYTVFLHLLDDQGALVSQDDSMPAAGASPTRIWQKDDIVRDQHRLANVVQGETLLVGAYDPSTGERLNAVQNQRPLPDNAFRISLSP